MLEHLEGEHQIGASVGGLEPPRRIDVDLGGAAEIRAR